MLAMRVRAQAGGRRPPPAAPGRPGQHDDEGEDGHRRLHEEDRPPRQELREDAPERRPGGGAHGGGRRPASPAPLGRAAQRAEHGKRPGQQQRRSHALSGPGHEQRAQGRGQSGGQAGPTEQGQPDERDRQRPEAPARQCERDGGHRHDQRIRREHPRHADDGGVERGVEIGQGEGDDRGVGEASPTATTSNTARTRRGPARWFVPGADRRSRDGGRRGRERRHGPRTIFRRRRFPVAPSAHDPSAAVRGGDARELAHHLGQQRNADGHAEGEPECLPVVLLEGMPAEVAEEGGVGRPQHAGHDRREDELGAASWSCRRSASPRCGRRG